MSTTQNSAYGPCWNAWTGFDSTFKDFLTALSTVNGSPHSRVRPLLHEDRLLRQPAARLPPYEDVQDELRGRTGLLKRVLDDGPWTFPVYITNDGVDWYFTSFRDAGR